MHSTWVDKPQGLQGYILFNTRSFLSSLNENHLCLSLLSSPIFTVAPFSAQSRKIAIHFRPRPHSPPLFSLAGKEVEAMALPEERARQAQAPRAHPHHQSPAPARDLFLHPPNHLPSPSKVSHQGRPPLRRTEVEEARRARSPVDRRSRVGPRAEEREQRYTVARKCFYRSYV